jgi:hypothetical protein
MIKLPSLDGVSYAQLVDDARALIPSLVPDWTDHNVTDPGIMLVELFAWLAEIVSYRIDRVPDRSYQTFLRLLRGSVPTAADGSPLALTDAIRATTSELRARYRAITSDDFEYLTLHAWPQAAGVIRRARCLAEQTPTTLATRWANPPTTPAQQGHFTLIVVADSPLAGRAGLAAFDPDQRYTIERDGAASFPGRRFALALDGNGFVDCGKDPALAITGDLTIAAWIFPRDLARGRQIIVAKAAAGEYELALEATGALAFRHADGEDGAATAEAAIAVGRWTHVAAVRAAAGTITLYVDGAAVDGAQPLARPAVATSQPVTIGGQARPGLGFAGLVRDVAIWASARGAADLGDDLRRRAPGVDDVPAPTTAPIASWRLDTLTPTAPGGAGIARDAMTPASAAPAARLRDGTLTGGATWLDVGHPLATTAATCDQLTAFFDGRRLLTTHVHAVDFAPLAVTVSADIYLLPDGTAATTAAAAPAAIDRHLDALTGGAAGTGWPFGGAIFVSAINAILDDLPGVDFVENVAIGFANASDAAAVGVTRPPSPRGDDGAAIGIALQPSELPRLVATAFRLLQREGTTWQLA